MTTVLIVEVAGVCITIRCDFRCNVTGAKEMSRYSNLFHWHILLHICMPPTLILNSTSSSYYHFFKLTRHSEGLTGFPTKINYTYFLK